MNKPMLIIAVAAALAGGSAAQASEGRCSVPMASWQPRAAVEQLARDKGWSVQRIRTDDGCYELRGRDDKGQRMRLRLDPATLKTVDAEIEYRNGKEED